MNPARVLLVAAGGTLGTAARLGLGLLLPDAGVLPVLLANILGALLIGILTARLFSPRTPLPTEPPGAGPLLSDPARLRLLLGTGVLGGFTTYSAFMTGAVGLWTDAPLLAAAYALGSLVLGLGAAALGLRIGRPHADRRPPGAAA